MYNIHTKTIKVHTQQPEQAIIEYAAKLLQAGKLVVFPTETVYGLGADALQPGAVAQIFAAKGRPFNDPLIVHIAELEMLKTLAKEIPTAGWMLMETFWPGPLTLILPAASAVPALVTSGLSTVAIRMPQHPVALALLRATGSPIAAPSANRFMHVSPTTAQHVEADLNGRVELILDGGPCPVGVESTVLDLCSEVPTILRPGGVSREKLQAVLPAVRYARPQQGSSGQELLTTPGSPGQMLVHYAPTVPTLLFQGSREVMRKTMRAEVDHYLRQGQQVGVLIADEDVASFQESGAQIYTLGKTSEEVATRLFAGLRALEEAGVQVILCRDFEDEGLGLAIRDRLLKATGGKVFREDRRDH